MPLLDGYKVMSPKLYIKVVTKGRSIQKVNRLQNHQCTELIQKKLIYLKPLNHKSIKTVLFFVFVESHTST